MSVTILRLPLVYGPGVMGNFLSLLKLCARGVPLPFASIENRRSMLGLDNLAGAICRCLADPRAEGKTYLVSDGEDVSTPDLIRRLAKCFGHRPRLIPFPLGILELGCRAVGHYAAYQRLTESLQVDSRAIAAELGWRPEASLNDGLRKTVDWFVAR
jgi:nucleoside-diphosphate-sugar epimerase